MMRVMIGSRPGAFGRRISPVIRRWWNTAPSGAWSPIFCATAIEPIGVVIRPNPSPRPNFEVETGYVVTFAPFCKSISFCSLTLTMT